MRQGKKSSPVRRGIVSQAIGQAIEKAQQQRLAWSVAAIEEATGLSQPFIRLKIHTGELPAKRVGRRVLVMDDDLRAFLAQKDYMSEAAA
ncbi:MAG TPA: excisionase family DNA-binding protein [Pyrinomonadaceae bacterium]|nr:excisionase family DNA-binding protein [Pyrinomonadaceae bacterium]